MSYAVAKPASCPSLQAAIAWVKRQEKPVQYDRFFMFPDTLALSLQLFEERYQRGVSWREMARAYASMNSRSLRKRVQRMADLLSWLWEGVIRPVFIPPSDWVKGERGEMLHERLQDVQGKTKKVAMTQVSRAENNEPMEDDIPIYHMVGEGERRIDRKLRRRLGNRCGVKLDQRERPRTLAQDLFMVGWPGSVHPKAKSSLGFTEVTAKWIRRNSAAVLHKLPYLLECLNEPRVAGWAALAILRLYGLKALPKVWYLQLFSDDRRKMELDRVWGYDTATKRSARQYARRLWLSFGGTRGVGGALPANMRNKETIRGIFRAVRETLETVPVNKQGRTPAMWASALWRFYSQLTRVEMEEGNETFVLPKRMPREKVVQLKLLKAAKKSAKENGVVLKKPKPKKPMDDGPSDLEEFVMKLGPSPEELKKREMKAERRADRMIARATGRNPFHDVDDFVRSLAQ